MRRLAAQALIDYVDDTFDEIRLRHEARGRTFHPCGIVTADAGLSMILPGLSRLSCAAKGVSFTEALKAWEASP